jgi:small subunit ribosomal protein S2
MMTNWQTISQSIKRLKTLDEQLNQEHTGLTKKETLQMTRQRDKLELSLGGIQDMGGLPDIIVVVDVNRDDLAVAEAQRLNIPVVGVIDTNSSPEGLEYPVPGNDDATRAIRLYCDLLAEAVLDGIQADLAAQGVDLGEAEAPVEEVAAEEAPAEEAAAEEVPAEAAAEKSE